jgi:hypothetical protein
MIKRNVVVGLVFTLLMTIVHEAHPFKKSAATKKEFYPTSFALSGSTSATYCPNGTAAAITATSTNTNCSFTGSGPNVYVNVTVQWYLNSLSNPVGTATNTTAATVSYSYTPTISGTGVFTYFAVISWSASANCAPAGSYTTGNYTMTVTNPTLTGVTQQSAVCGGSNATIVLTGLMPSTFQKVSYNINGGSTQSVNLTSNSSGVGTFTTAVTTVNNGQPLTVTSILVNAGCTTSFSSSNSTTLTVNGGPTITSQPSTSGQTLCKNSVATALSVSASDASGITTYQWYSNASNSNSGGTLVATHSSSATTDTYTPVTSTQGTLYYYCTVTNGNSCTTTSNVSGAIVVQNGTSFNTQPSSATQNICLNGTATALTVAATGGGSTTYQWYSSPNSDGSGSTLIGGATSTSYTPLTTSVGTLYYYCVATNGCSATSTVSGAIIIAGNPTTATNGSTQSICATGTATLSGNTPVVGTGAWSVVSGPSTLATQFSNTANPAAIFTPAGGAGSYVLRWTISNSPCTSTIADATITVAGTPTTATNGSTQSICVTGTATLSGNSPVVGTGAWSVVSGPSTLSTQFSNTLDPAATFTPAGGAGTYIVRWMISNSPCASSIADANITVAGTPTTATNGSTQSICVTSTATLSGNSPVVGTGSWSVVSGPSTLSTQFSSTTDPAATFTPAGGVGSYLVRWTISSSPCIASTADATITVGSSPTAATNGSTQSICVSGTATLSGNTPVVGTGAWSVVSGPSTLSTQFSNTTDPAATFTPAGGAGSYVVRWTISNAPCTPSSDDATITVNSAGATTWTGNTSTNWSDATNWSCGVPTSSTDVDIPGFLIYYPVVSPGATVSVKSLTIEFGASLQLNSTSTLKVYGDFINYSALVTSLDGTVDFAGSTLQNLGGSGGSAISFNNINITNTTSSVSVESDQSLKGVLTLSSNAVFDPDGSSDASVFTLLSSSDLPTVDASIATLPSESTSAQTNNQIVGKVTVERYMGRSGASVQYHVYRDISSPVHSTTPSDYRYGSVYNLQNSLPVTGPFTNSSTVTTDGSTPDNTVNYSVASLTSYNEPTTGAFNNGWIGFPTSGGDSKTSYFQAGKGYSLFIFGSDYPVNQPPYSAKWSLTGMVNSGQVSLPVTLTKTGTGGTYNSSTDGWNLVGNPYPSTIDWEASTGWSRTNINNAFYIEDFSSGTDVFATYVHGASTNTTSQYIAVGQAFWIKANVNTASAPSLKVDERVKAAGTQTNFYRKSAPDDLLRVTLSDESMRDEAVIYFDESATADFDSEYDAFKLMNGFPAFNLATVSDKNEKFAINALPVTECKRTVSLDVSDVVSGTYSLKFSDFESMSSSTEIMLKDNFKNSLTDVRQNSNYTFDVDQNNNSTFGSERFSLIFNFSGQTAKKCDLSPVNTVSAYPNPVNGIITVEAPGENTASGEIYNSLGLSLAVMNFVDSGGKQTAQFDFKKESSGVYFIKVSQGDRVEVIRIVKD